MSEIKEYLETMKTWQDQVNADRAEGFKYLSYEALVLDKGTEFAVPERARPKGVRKLANKLCYNNSMRRMIEHDWRYVEGYAFGQVTVVQHAWCLDENNTVIETTWAEPGSGYIGIEFSYDEIAYMVTKTGLAGILGNDWDNNYSLLRFGEIRRENGRKV